MPRPAARKISVGIAEYRVAEAPDTLVTLGLGSCVAIAVYDPAARVGALAHTLLPSRHEDAPLTAKFADAAVALMVEELGKTVCEAGRLVAKLAGGAHMFRGMYGSSRGTIGERNVRAAKEALERHGIPLVAEDTGGDYGRSVVFSPGSGEMAVKALLKPGKAL